MTFSLIFLALGVVAILDLLDVFPIGAAGYFAAALATIGLGLLVGTWFGRARWLIALGLVDRRRARRSPRSPSPTTGSAGSTAAVTWAPADYRSSPTGTRTASVTPTLDLRGVDFDKRDSRRHRRDQLRRGDSGACRRTWTSPRWPTSTPATPPSSATAFRRAGRPSAGAHRPRRGRRRRRAAAAHRPCQRRQSGGDPVKAHRTDLRLVRLRVALPGARRPGGCSPRSSGWPCPRSAGSWPAR